MANTDLFLQSALRNIPPEAVDAILSGSLMKDRSHLAVLDVDGNPLIGNGVYDHPRYGPVQVLSQSFGSGNCMDTYYRVYYRDSRFKESFLVSEATWVEGKRQYQSPLSPVDEFN